MVEIRFAPGLMPVLKHAKHNQLTHGSWATGGGQGGVLEGNPGAEWVMDATWWHGTSTSGLDEIDAKNAPSRYANMGSGYSIIKRNFVTTSYADAAQYAVDAARQDKNNDVDGSRPVVYQVKPTSLFAEPDSHGGFDGWSSQFDSMQEAGDFWDQGGGSISVAFEDPLLVVQEINPDDYSDFDEPVAKHLGNQHNQLTHGSWAGGQSVSRRESEWDGVSFGSDYDRDINFYMEESDPPKTLYHAAPKAAREDIAVNGLDPQEKTWNVGGEGGDKYEDEHLWRMGDDGEEFAYEYRPVGIYMFEKKSDGEQYATGSGMDLYSIDTDTNDREIIRDPSVAREWDYEDRHTFVTRYVDPSALTIVSSVAKHLGNQHNQKTHGRWAGGGSDYQMTHRPDLEGAPLNDLTTEGYYPENVYSDDAARLYSTGYKSMDARAHKLIQSVKGKPDAPVQIYRAVPKNTTSEIGSGDWVTIDEEYAIQHGESNVSAGYDILTRTVAAKEIFTSGDSWLEWGYAPAVEKHLGRGHDQKRHGRRGGYPSASDLNITEEAWQQQQQNMEYISGRSSAPPDWAVTNVPYFSLSREFKIKVRETKRRIRKWKIDREQRQLAAMSAEELAEIGAANQARYDAKRIAQGLAPVYAKAVWHPIYGLLRNVFGETVDDEIWVAFTMDPLPFTEIDGLLGGLLDDMFDAVLSSSVVIKFEPGLIPVLKHLSGEHDQKTHGSWAVGVSSSGLPKSADFWIGGVPGIKYQQTEEVRATARVLVGGDNYYPKDDGANDPVEMFDATKSLMIAISDAEPIKQPLYRGLRIWNPDSKERLLLKEGNEFSEMLSSWTPNELIASQFASGDLGRGVRTGERSMDYTEIVLRTKNLPAVPLVQFYSGDKSGNIGKADEHIASGKYRVEKVTKTSGVPEEMAGSYIVDVVWQDLPFDAEIVRNTEYTGGRSIWNGESAIIRKSFEQDFAHRMSLDLLDDVTKHLAGKHDQKRHGNWAGSVVPKGWVKTKKGESQYGAVNDGHVDEYAGSNNSFFLVDTAVNDFAFEDLATQMQTLTYLQEIAPISDLVTIVSNRPFDAIKAPPNANGFFERKKNTINLRPTAIISGTENQYLMQNGPNPKEYALVHEYGHALDKRTDRQADEDYLFVRYQGNAGGMSRYAYEGDADGRTGREAFAEAWTGWIGSEGNAKPGSMVKFFADKYNWRRAEYGRPPLATRPASAGFAKELSGEFIIADTFTDEGALLIPVESGFFKHYQGEHDQKTHGAWATGGSGYAISSAQDILLSSDTLRKKVYAAEYALHRPMNEKLAPISDRPVAPVRGKEDWDEYSAAYDIYEKKFDSWVIKRNSLIISDVGRKHLDGTKKGIQNYVNEVVTSDSFVNDFGDGGQFGIPPVKITNNKQNVSGVYRIGYRNGKYFTDLGIDKRYASDETTILHEIAHYATSISQRSHFEAHGTQYVLNHLSLVEDVMGVEMADQLKSEYEDQGISL